MLLLVLLLVPLLGGGLAKPAARGAAGDSPSEAVGKVEKHFLLVCLLHSMTFTGTSQHSTAQHGTARHSTAQHSTAQHSTAQHSTATLAQRCKIRHGTSILHIYAAEQQFGHLHKCTQLPSCSCIWGMTCPPVSLSTSTHACSRRTLACVHSVS